MKNEVTTTTWTCDVCNAECVPLRTLSHVSQYINTEPMGIELRFKVFGSQCQDDICAKCAIAAMRGVLKQLEREPCHQP